MRYKQILHQAYTLTLSNPILWLFGLVLLGGFNLSIVNFFALIPQQELAWPTSAVKYAIGPDLAWTLIGAGILFALLNFIKVMFIAVGHNLIHDTRTKQCQLCVHVENKTSPYYAWWLKVLLASAITVGVTLLLNFALTSLVYNYAQAQPYAQVFNLIVAVVMTCTLGTWNAFTGYFVVMHGLNFRSASRAAIDLMVLKFRNVTEFVVILLIIYVIAVFIGNAFINIWHHGFMGSLINVFKISSIAIFVAWTALSNVFFNLSFLIFFDEAVRSTPVPEETPPLAQMP